VLISDGVTAQEHFGKAGKKTVLRGPGAVSVLYNGKPADSAEVKRAAALVADAYALFLMGPHYFQRPGVVLSMDGEAEVEGGRCDRVLALLRPGFGEAKEDRVVLFLDRDTHVLRRVHLTLNGLESTQGAEVDVTMKAHRRVHGVLWPVEWDERIRVPFDLHAHHWSLTGIDINRGLTKADVQPGNWSARAAKPAANLLP
jgi:hypothetical protein